MRRGFIYTLFVIFVLSLVFLILTNPLNLRSLESPGERIRVDEQYYFLESIQEDFGRANKITGKRAITAAINYVLGEEKPLYDAEEGIKEAFVNGTINGSNTPIMEESTIENWIGRVKATAANSGFENNISMIYFDIIPENKGLIINTSYDISLGEPRINSEFHINKIYLTKVSFVGLEDPLNYIRSKGGYSSSYKFTNFNYHGLHVASGSGYDYNVTEGWDSGRAVVEFSNLSSVSDKDEKIAVIDDPCSYELGEIAGFKGIISESPVTCDISTSYIEGVNNAREIMENDMMAVMNGEEVWVNNIIEELENDYYFVDSLENSPTFLDRLANNLSGENKGEGIARFLNIPEIPPELQRLDSAVDYVYWNSDNPDLHKIKGVSDHREWFRLDQEHIEAWNLTELAYN